MPTEQEEGERLQKSIAFLTLFFDIFNNSFFLFFRNPMAQAYVADMV